MEKIFIFQARYFRFGGYFFGNTLKPIFKHDLPVLCFCDFIENCDCPLYIKESK